MDLWNERDRVQKAVSFSHGCVGERKRAVRKCTRVNALTVPRIQLAMDHRAGKCANKSLKRRSIWKQNAKFNEGIHNWGIKLVPLFLHPPAYSR